MKYFEFTSCGSCGIYLIKNIITGSVYVGQTTRPFVERWKEHINIANNLNAQYSVSSVIKAIRKYGLENFDFIVLEQCDKQNLDAREIFWISVFEADSHNNYNQTAGGQNSALISAKPNYFYEVIDLLKNSKLTIKQIANQYNLNLNCVYDINSGRTFFDSKFCYPIRTLTGAKKIFWEQYKLICDDIKNSTLTFIQIAQKYNLSISSIKRINNGTFSYKLLNEIYPLRSNKETLQKTVNTIITLLKDSTLSISEIAVLTKSTDSWIYKINSGIRNFNPNLTYPIRKLK